jgi:hypothetical protein
VKVKLHLEAEGELYEAAAWYNRQREGVGDEFLGEIGRWLEMIAEAPSTWPKWRNAPPLDPPIQRVLTGRFPYAIAYQAFSSHVYVLCFAHTSRRPFYWAKRTET